MQNRKYYIDVMKFIGIGCLFFAHVQGPDIAENLRGFDVPMMVLLSGFLSTSSLKKIDNPLEYILKRIKRLVIPTWIFLVIFYLCMIIIGQKPQYTDVIKSFLFQRDCGLAGGVWIIWVYLICAIISPLISNIMNKNYFFSIYFCILVIYDAVVSAFPSIVEVRVIYYSIFTIIPYGIVYALGMYLNKSREFDRRVLVCCMLGIHIVLGICYFLKNGVYQPIAQYKYPARIYYLSYGVAISIILMGIFSKIENKIPKIKIVIFVSQHSLWIYLWQIMMLTVINYVIKINNNWWLSWLVLMIGSILLTWFQNIVVNKIYNKFNFKVLRYFKA